MLCYDGQLRNGSVAHKFIPLSNTATSSATGEYLTVPERPNRNEEPTSRNEGQTRNVPISYPVLPQKLFNELRCIFPLLEHETLNYLTYLFYFNQE